MIECFLKATACTYMEVSKGVLNSPAHIPRDKIACIMYHMTIKKYIAYKRKVLTKNIFF